MFTFLRFRPLAALACLVAALPLALSAAVAPKPMQRGAAYALHPVDGRLLPIPLESTEVVLDIKPGLLETQVIQTFVNRTTTALEATYLYPLPEGSTLTEFELRFANRTVRSVVKEKSEAAEVYEKAKKQGKKAALIEQHDPMLFSTAVANFLPGERVEVVIKIIQPLTLAKDFVEVRFPMVTGDKYFPVEATPGELGNAAPDPLRRPAATIAENHVYSFDIQVAGIPVQRMNSSTHRIRMTELGATPERYKVALTEEITIPDRDFELRIETRPDTAMQPSVITQHTARGDYGLVTFFPPAKGPAAKTIRPRDVLFLIDRSGSMGGTRIDNAKLGLEACLDFLTPQDRFQIVTFSSTHEFYKPGWIQGGSRAFAAAHAYVRSIQIQGGTELQPALESSLSAFDSSEREQILILLTDGDVGNPGSLLNLVDKKIGRTRLFALGIGEAPNSALLRRIAEIGRGQARFINDDATIARELEDLFATLDAPVLTQPTLTLLDASDTVIEFDMFPERLPDLFARRPVQATFRTRSGPPATALIEGMQDGRKVSQRVALRQTNLRGDGLEKQFGQRLYSDTELMLHRAQSHKERATIRAELLATALQYQLVTELTSRVAVDNRVSRDPHAPLTSQEVAQYLPADQAAAKAPLPSSLNYGGGRGGRGGGGGDIVILTPFEVSTDKDVGYMAGNSMSGGRVMSSEDMGLSTVTLPENRTSLRQRIAGAAKKIFGSDDDKPTATPNAPNGPWTPPAEGSGATIAADANAVNFIKEYQGSGHQDLFLSVAYHDLAALSGRVVHRGDDLAGTLGLSSHAVEQFLDAKCQQLGLSDAWKTKYAGRYPLNTVDDYLRVFALILNDSNLKQ